MVSIYAVLKRSLLRWAGHVCHMSNKYLPKRLLFGDHVHSFGGQKEILQRHAEGLPEVLWHQAQ